MARKPYQPRVSISMHRVNSMVPPPIINMMTTTRFVLVADDDERARRLMVRALRTLYTVYEVTDGEQAWRVLQGANKVDCAIVSLQLPLVNGMALAKQIRSDARLRSLPVVFLTGVSSATQVAEGVGVGVRHVLRKPVKVKDLVDAIATLTRES